MRIQDSDEDEPYIAEDSDEEERMLQTAIEVSVSYSRFAHQQQDLELIKPFSSLLSEI